MTSGNGSKLGVARRLTALLGLLSAQVGGRPRVVPVGTDRAQPLRLGELGLLERIEFTGTRSLPEVVDAGWSGGGRPALRVVISDFLFPCDPFALARRLASHCGQVWWLQLLTEWETNPPITSGRTLVDLETNRSLPLLLDRATIDRYLERFARLREQLSDAANRVGGRLVPLVCDRGLTELCRDDLCRAGLLAGSAGRG